MRSLTQWFDGRRIAGRLGRFTWTPPAIANASWWTLTLVMAVGLLVPGRLVGDGPGLRRFLTPEITGNTRISQTFRMNAWDMDAIEIYPAAVGPLSGTLRLTLTDYTLRKGVVRSADVAAADVARTSSYVFAFEPVERSRDHVFRLDITPSPASGAGGVAFWATKGARLPEAALFINDVERWSDLAFRARAPMSSAFRALVETRDPARPPYGLGLACLIVVWASVRLLLRAVAEPIRSQDVP
jgi:hypothetical protein